MVASKSSYSALHMAIGSVDGELLRQRNLISSVPQSSISFLLGCLLAVGWKTQVFAENGTT
jgi:hypothetical protein